MKVLILSCSTGQGHNAVSGAIQEALEMRGIYCETVETLQFISDRFSRFMSWGHSFLYRHMPRLFDAGYEAAEKHSDTLEEGAVLFRLFARGAGDLHDYCNYGGFDVVLCTHVFSALMFTQVRRAHGSTARSYFVATDYTCSPGAPESDLDGYFIPAESLVQDFCGKNLYPVGIPIYRDFFTEVPAAEAKAQLGINPAHMNILIMCGSMGCGPIEEVTEKLCARMPENLTLSIVCGTNRSLQRKLTAAFGSDPRVRIHGYTDRIPLMMDAADLYITKPGGISTTEAMAKGLPMVLMDTVSGCEDYNMRFFTGMGGAVAAREADDIVRLCLQLIDDAPRRAAMAETLRSNRKNAAEHIADILCGGEQA